MIREANIILQDCLIFSYDEQNMTANVIGNNYIKGEVFIPRSIIYQSQEFLIVNISKGSFKDSSDIKTVKFPSNSFIQTIEEESFAFSTIESISIPSQVKKIGEKSFYFCSKMKNIIIPNDSQLQVIEKEAFRGTLIENIFIPSTLSDLQDGWCSGMSKLKNITINPENKHYKYQELKKNNRW